MSDFEAARLSECVGCEITGFDTTAPMAAADRERFVDLFHRHGALVFRGPVLTPHQYVAFIRNFGEPDGSDTSRYHEPVDVDGFKGLRLVSNIEREGKAIGQFGSDKMGWHQDRWTDAAPPPATALHGVEVTKTGGRTGIANLCEAWDAMPAALRARVKGRSIHFPLQVNDFVGDLDDADPEDETLFRTVPMVQRHAVTGREFVFLGARRILSYIDTAPRVSGLDKEQSAALLDEVYGHIAQPQFAYLHRWRVGDILIWDNRCCAHRREAFDPAERRLLYGTPIVASDLLWRVPQIAAA